MAPISYLNFFIVRLSILDLLILSSFGRQGIDFW